MSKSLEDKYSLSEGCLDSERLDFQNSLMRKLTNRVFELALKIKNLDNVVVLDFGCGTSSAYRDILNNIGNNSKYIGVDASEAQIKFSKSSFPNNSYICGNEDDVDVINAIKNSDVIFMRFVVMHQKNPQEFISHMFKHMKPNSILIIEEPESRNKDIEEISNKYPCAKTLYAFKAKVGKIFGVDYDSAKNLESTLKNLNPAKILYEIMPCYSTISQAKELYLQTAKSIAEKSLESKVMLKNDIDEFINAIDELPDSDHEQWILDSMHLAVIMK